MKSINNGDTIGLLLCKGKNEVLAEYALKGYNQPIGVSDYQISKAIQRNLNPRYRIKRFGKRSFKRRNKINGQIGLADNTQYPIDINLDKTYKQ